MATATLFQNYVHLIENKSLIIITKQIQEGKYKEQVEEIRKLIAEGQEKEADRLKKQLPGFTPSGTFENGRKADLLTQYSGYLILDLDKLNPKDLANAKNKAAEIPHTFAAFISPSGNGLKIIVAVSSNAEHHNLAFQQVFDYYEQVLELEVDPSGKDVCRLCFMSYDPECYRNINAEPFMVNIESEWESKKKQEPTIAEKTQEKAEQPDNKQNDWAVVFLKCVDLTDTKSSYEEGNRNNYVHLLACNCNRAGIPQQIAEGCILQTFDLDPKEVMATIKSAYVNNAAEFASFADFAIDEKTARDEALLNMPYIPDEIFPLLPNILREGSRVFEDRRERDIFLTAALGIISGCMSNVVGLYRGKEHYANLFVFVIAPSASNKNAVALAKTLGNKLHAKLLAESQAKRKKYNIELELYKRKLSDKRQDISQLEPPEEPQFKILFIPGNSSSARVMQHLKDGDGRGIFCETEADTIGIVIKQDWGGYSDLLRKVFHHEDISYSRKTDNEWIEIKNGRISIVLASTPNQVEGLIKSAEDGLFSRFIYYTFKSKIEWIYANDTLNGINLTAHFDALSYKVLHFVESLEKFETVRFSLTQRQWEILNAFGETHLITSATFVSEELASTSKRLPLILYRVAMIITALRYYDNGELAPEYICTDDDFEIALKLVKTYEEHSVFMFKELPKQATVADKLLKKFFDKLPASFLKNDAITLAERMFRIKERTAYGYLSKLLAFGWIERIRNGIYQKIR